MTTPIEQLAFRPTRAPAITPPTNLGDYAGRVVHVKDYGAIGNGATDDTDAIQAAFNAAFNMSMFQAFIDTGTSTTAILHVTGPATTATTGLRPKSFAPIVAGMVLVFPDVPRYPPSYFYPVIITIAALGTAGTTGTGGIGTYSLSFNISLTPDTFPNVASQPMMVCSNTQATYNTRPVCIDTGSYFIYSPLYIFAVLGAHVYGDGNGAVKLLYLGDGKQKNILINSGSPANNNYTAVIAMDAVAYSKFDGFSLEAYPGTQAEQGAVPVGIQFLGSITGDVMTVTSGPFSGGVIVAGMTVLYNLAPSGPISPLGLTILPLGTGGTTGTGLLGTYKLSSTPTGTIGAGSLIQGLSVVPIMTGIMAYQSGILGVTSALEWAHLNISKMYAGVVGVQGLGNVENCILYNCNITNCGLRGVWLTNQNVLNWQVYGGGAAQCGWLSTFEIAGGTGEWGGGYYAGSGSIGCLYGLSCSGNQWDVYGGQQCHVIGGSFEGGPNFTCSLSWAAGTATITTSPYPHNLRFDQPIAVFQTSLPGYEGRFNGHITGPNTITYPLVSNPGSTGSGYVAPTNAGGITNISYPMALSGLAFRGGDSDYYLPIYCAGTLTVDACSVSVAHAGNTGYISYLSNGSISFNQCAFNSWTNASFKNAGSSRIYLKGTQWIGTPTNPFSQFTGGTIMEYDLVQNITVATLPTAAATLTGLRGSVTDLNIARAFGGSVLTHGGGSTFCPVVCTGADWIMG